MEPGLSLTIKLHLIGPSLPSYVFNGGSNEFAKRSSEGRRETC